MATIAFASCLSAPSRLFAQTTAPPPAANKNLAPGFTGPSAKDPVVLMPVDVELFSLSAGGVAEPKADWTAAAQQHMQAALTQKQALAKLPTQLLSEADADEFAEQVGLHAAVASSIALHHGIGGVWQLPTKAGVLDWNFGDAMQPLRAKTGARYALFIWVRDTYASAERKAAMVALALLGVGIPGGVQVGYASLVDLESGRVVWFNRLARGWGDLREAGPAKESIDALLSGLPPAQ
ncbi:MAG TPA: hypothetical protein VI032_01215 [Burkholderiaceae bacterium]